MAARKNRTLVFIAITVSLASVLCLTISSAAKASLVGFKFSGIIVETDDPVRVAPPGTPFSGAYVVESTTPDLKPGDPFSGSYALTSLSFSMLGNTYSSPTSTLAPSTLDVTYIPSDSFNADEYLVTTNFHNLIGNPINGFPPGPFFFQILRPNMYTDDSLPLTPPSLGNLTGTSRSQMVGITFGNEFGSSSMAGQLTSLEVTPVPLPGTFLLFGFGVIGLMGLKTWRRLTT